MPKLPCTLLLSLLALGCSRPAVPLPVLPATPAPPSSAAQPPVIAAPEPPPSPCAPLALLAPDIPAEHLSEPVPPLLDPSGRAMHRFYQRLARVLRGTARDHVRIGYYGDSNMTLDLISGSMRRLVQGKFGDAGHGFVAVGRPWRHYQHRDVVHDLDQTAWEEYAISTRKLADRLYGFSGIAAQSTQKGAKAWLRTAPEASPIGRTASRLEVHYLRRPGAGTFSVLLDGKPLADIPTAHDALAAGVSRFDFPDGPHALDFVAHGRRPVRLLGAALERSAPGIIVDALGIGGVSAHALAESHPATTAQSFANRRYDLVILMLGTNTVLPSTQPKAMQELISVRRQGIADVSVLVMSPPDHVTSFRDGRTDPVVRRVAAQMREVAAHNDCAFWDFWQAMGGESSMLQFHKKKWNMWDLYHLNEKGAAYMASRIVHALWQGFGTWLQEHPEAGCEPEAAPVDESGDSG
jgi:lysophospholipase L1-like esterase